MAFIAETEVLSDTGWKKIEDIAGQDRILVRNFLGDAQFLKPFAIRRKKYDGRVILGGSKHYSFKVTPTHEIVYTDKNDKQFKAIADGVSVHSGNYLQHRSRYYPQNNFPQQFIKTGNIDNSIENVDWYKLVGYVLRKGRIDTQKDRLFLSLDKDNLKKDMDLICGVLDNMGLEWTFVEPKTIVVSQKSNIANKLVIALGSRPRKNMHIPDKMIYNSTTEYATALLETFMRASRKDGKGVDKILQFTTSNKKLIKSMEILGLLSGYTVSSRLIRLAGYKIPAGVTKRNSYAVYIRKSMNEVNITVKRNEQYLGTVYEIDIFEGQVMTRVEGSLPIWMQPK